MKILHYKKVTYKVIFYVLVGYLISTWGVNQTINPVTYIKQLSAQTVPVPIIDGEEYVKVTNYYLEDYPYLLLNIVESDQYFETFLIKSEENSIHTELCKGINCLNMYSYGESILLSKSQLKKYNVRLGDVFGSSEKYVDIYQTLSIFVSFLFFSVFWELVQWIKRRYTR